MTIPTFWARRDYTHRDPAGYDVTRSALGWSSDSLADAERMAARRADRFARASADGRPATDEGEGLYYATMPLREPVLDTLDVGGESVAIVTRNGYGCRVLNAGRVLFADVDLTPPWPRPPERGWLRRVIDVLWIRPLPPPPSPAEVGSDLERAAAERVRAWHARTGVAVRIYRTFAGLRLMLVDRQYDPADPATLDVLRDLHSDPLYVSLTKRQECFRARLSPKPWRVGVPTPLRWSQIDHPDYPAMLERWAVGYERAAAAYATCRFVDAYGPIADDPAIRGVIELHDRHALAADVRPLA